MTDHVDEAPEQLPREPWTLLRSLTRHARPFALFAVFAAAAGFLAARDLAREFYAAEAVLLFTPIPADERASQPARLESRRDMVKVLPNLREVIRRRQLPVTPAQLGSIVDAKLRRDSSVLAIEARWPNPVMAAAIANDLSALFLDQQAKVRRSGMEKLVADLERQQARGRERLKRAADELGRFRQERGALALDDQIRTAIADVSLLQSQLDSVTVERENLRRQRANLPAVVAAVSRQLSEGQFGKTAAAPAEAQAREAARLRGAIEDERRSRERATALAGAQAQLERVKRLTRIGLLPKSEMTKAELDYRKAHDAAVDTPRIAAWREKVDSIEEKLNVGSVGGGALAPEVGLRSFQIELDSVAIEDKRKYLEDALGRARAQLASFAPLQRAIFDLETERSRHERELAALEEPLVRARRAASSDASEFQLVSRAQPDPDPVTRRKLMAFGGVSGGLMLLFAGLVLAREIACNRIRSGRELHYLSRLPVFAQVVERRRPQRAEAALDVLENELELTARLSRRLEQSTTGGTARVMITGAASPQERQRVVDALLAQYILQGRRVAWISMLEDDRADGEATFDPELGAPSIQEYLRGGALPAERLLESQPAESVALIGGAVAVAPHLRSSTRMRELVRRAAETFDLVLLIGDSLVASPDELVLARECDVVVLVAEAEKTTHEEVERLSRLARDADLASCGWLLIGVRPEFSSLDS